MASERLFDAAFRFRKAKPWKMIRDTAIFAVRLPEGETGFVSIMGMLGQHVALALYEGNSGLESMRICVRASEEETLADMYYAMLCQECLQCAFESRAFVTDDEYREAKKYAGPRGITFRGAHAFPHFLHYRKGREPWRTEPEDEEKLILALDAACEAVRLLREDEEKALSLGLMPGDLYNRNIPFLSRENGAFTWSQIPLPPADFRSYPMPEFRNDVLAARAKKEKRFGTFAVDLACIPIPTGKPGEEIPYIPCLALLVEVESGLSMSLGVVLEGVDSSAEVFANFLKESLAKTGHLPSDLLVSNDRTEMYFTHFCERTRIRLTRRDSIPELLEAEDAMYEFFLNEETYHDLG